MTLPFSLFVFSCCSLLEKDIELVRTGMVEHNNQPELGGCRRMLLQAKRLSLVILSLKNFVSSSRMMPQSLEDYECYLTNLATPRGASKMFIIILFLLIFLTEFLYFSQRQSQSAKHVARRFSITRRSLLHTQFLI